MSETPDEGPTYPDGFEPVPEQPDADRTWKFPTEVTPTQPEEGSNDE